MEITSYNQAQKYLESLIKPFQVEKIVGVPEIYNNPFGRMTCLLDLLGNPQQKFRSIVVSGTSGKGSTTYSIAHLLTTAGYKIGMATSPHLKKLNERIQIGVDQKLQMISDKQVITLLNRIIPAIEQMRHMPLGEPSYFETLLAMSFCYFASKKVDLAVVEVGLEGKYDGTQILSPLIFVYTNTSLDHTQMLGETIEAIAKEGVSVVEKTRVKGKELVVVSGVSQPSVKKILEDICKKFNAKLFLLDKDFSYTLRAATTTENIFTFDTASMHLSDVHTTLVGSYQMGNISLALEAVLQLSQFGFSLSEKQIREALATAFFAGRFEKKENIILDGAHNPAKMQAFLTSLQQLYPTQKKIFILGFKEDKKIDAMLQMIVPLAEQIITTEYAVPMDVSLKSAYPSHLLYQQIHTLFPEVPLMYTPTVADAISLAKKHTQENELVVITGSLYLVGEALTLLG